MVRTLVTLLACGFYRTSVLTNASHPFVDRVSEFSFDGCLHFSRATLTLIMSSKARAEYRKIVTKEGFHYHLCADRLTVRSRRIPKPRLFFEAKSFNFFLIF